MNRMILLYIGIILAVVASSLGMVFIPEAALFDLEPYETEPGVMQPERRTEFQEAGRRLYSGLGCIYCHSQQVRPEGFGADIDRGWGSRRSVARDYIYDRPHLLGTMRTGPDLFNIGSRQPDKNWHYQHLYDPQITSPGSIMPPFRFLFERRKVEAGRELPFNVVRMPPGVVDEGEMVIPTAEAEQLVEYLLSLKHDYDLPEAR